MKTLMGLLLAVILLFVTIDAGFAAGCDPGYCVLSGGQCGLPQGAGCRPTTLADCQSLGLSNSCLRSDGQCGTLCNDPLVCGSALNQCITVAMEACLEAGGCIRSDGSCGYFCGENGCGPGQRNQCVSWEEGGCWQRGCDWINGACNCKRLCEEAGCSWTNNTCVCPQHNEIPEPATLVLAGTAFLGLAVARRLRKNRPAARS